MPVSVNLYFTKLNTRGLTSPSACLKSTWVLVEFEAVVCVSALYMLHSGILFMHKLQCDLIFIFTMPLLRYNSRQWTKTAIIVLWRKFESIDQTCFCPVDYKVSGNYKAELHFLLFFIFSYIHGTISG